MIWLLLLQTVTVPASEHDRRYVLAEWTGDGDVQLRDTKSGKVVPCQRDGKKVRWLIREGLATSMESFASMLYDPKRVAAGAAGIPVRPAALRAD